MHSLPISKVYTLYTEKSSVRLRPEMEKAKSFLAFPWNFHMELKVILIFIFENVFLELTEIEGEERISILDRSQKIRAVAGVGS